MMTRASAKRQLRWKVLKRGAFRRSCDFLITFRVGYLAWCPPITLQNNPARSKYGESPAGESSLKALYWKRLFLSGWLYKPAGSIYNRGPRCNNYCGRDELHDMGKSKQMSV